VEGVSKSVIHRFPCSRRRIRGRDGLPPPSSLFARKTPREDSTLPLPPSLLAHPELMVTMAVGAPKFAKFFARLSPKLKPQLVRSARLGAILAQIHLILILRSESLVKRARQDSYRGSRWKPNSRTGWSRAFEFVMSDAGGTRERGKKKSEKALSIFRWKRPLNKGAELPKLGQACFLSLSLSLFIFLCNANLNLGAGEKGGKEKLSVSVNLSSKSEEAYATAVRCRLSFPLRSFFFSLSLSLMSLSATEIVCQ